MSCNFNYKKSIYRIEIQSDVCMNKKICTSQDGF